MPSQENPVIVNNARPVTLSALDIVTSKFAALIVRTLTVQLGIATIVFAAIELTDDTPQYRPFLIALIFSLTYNITDASMVIFEVWKFPSPIIRTPSQRHEMVLGCRAGPRWRGTFDIVVGIVLLVTTGGLTGPYDPLERVKADPGSARVAQYLGATTSMGHLWMCGMAATECFLEQRREEIGTRINR